MLKLSALAGLGLAVPARGLGTRLAAPPRARGASDATVPTARRRSTGGCLWGAYAEPRGAQDARSAIVDLEHQIDRRLAISRHYAKWNDPLPNGFQEWSVSRGRIPYVSWHAETTSGGPVAWSSIAGGQYDDWIARQARSLRRSGFRMFFTFHHEPENDPDTGNAAEFVAAYDRIRGIFREHRVPNLTWIVTLMASTYSGGNGGPGAWMPSSFRYCGADGYNRYPCFGEEWQTFSALFAPARDFAKSRGKGLFIGEYGCPEQDCCGNTSGDPGAKALWFREASQTIKSWPEVKAAVYSHAYSDQFQCAYWVDTRRRSLAAFRHVGLKSYFS
jgi:hypothetical protein